MASLTRGEREEYSRKLDMMGWTLINYLDPVDHSGSPVLDLDQVIGLMKDYEERLLDAVQSRPIVIKIDTDEKQDRFVHMAVETAVAAEREAIIAEVLAAAPPVNAELSHDGAEDPSMAAYVEAWHSMWAIVNARKTP